LKGITCFHGASRLSQFSSVASTGVSCNGAVRFHRAEDIMAGLTSAIRENAEGKVPRPNALVVFLRKEIDDATNTEQPKSRGVVRSNRRLSRDSLTAPYLQRTGTFRRDRCQNAAGVRRRCVLGRAPGTIEVERCVDEPDMAESCPAFGLCVARIPRRAARHRCRASGGA